MSTPQIVAQSDHQHRGEILSALKEIVNELTGIDPEQMDVDANFLEAGIDSLTLIQATQAIQTKYDVRLSVVELLEEHTTLNAVAAHLSVQLPPQQDQTKPLLDLPQKDREPVSAATASFTEPAARTSPSQTQVEGAIPSSVLEQIGNPAPSPKADLPAPSNGAKNISRATSASALERIIDQQLQLMSQQLELLLDNPQGSPSLPQQEALPAGPLGENQQPATNLTGSTRAEQTEHTLATSNLETSPGQIKTTPYSPFQPIEPGTTKGLTPRQKEYLDQFIATYNQRTGESKRLTQNSRPVFSDSRSSVGFRLLWKDLIYPIIGQRSAGSRMWDVDGNEYIDIAMGFGMHLFGHSPDFIVEALEKQLKLGLQLGPQSMFAGEVAKLVCELTGMERANFCNSGTEAVMGAMRLARTITRRPKVAMFTGSYHGWSDGTLGRQLTIKGISRTVPLAPGISPRGVEDTLVLDWDDPGAIDLLRSHADELAAVLVESVQSRRPDHQPREFLIKLRKMTAEVGAALIFDEIVTGFRIGNGGAQAWYGLQADLATYGKIVGGGLPIGIIAGKSAYMDAFDGGMWNYGDDSYPRKEKTIFAGSFFKHPLTMAASFAVLNRLKHDPELLPRLNHRTSLFVAELNDYFTTTELPIRVVNFGSLFRFVVAPDLKWIDLFFYHLIVNGVYTWEGRNCFLSTAHTDEDLERIKQAISNSVSQMRAGGFFPDARSTSGLDSASAVSADKRGEEKETEEAYPIPLSDAQQQLWLASQMSVDASSAYNDSVTLHLRGSFDLKSMGQALQRLVDRHESLRSTFSPEGDFQWVSPTVTIELPLTDFSMVAAEAREAKVAAWTTGQVLEPFDLVLGPLMRTRLLKLDDQYHLLVLTYHHLVVDGESLAVLLSDLGALYTAESRGVACPLPPAKPFSEYIERQSQMQQGPEMAAAEAYWLAQFADSIPLMELPTDRPRPFIQTQRGAQRRTRIDAALYAQLKQVGMQQGSTTLMFLLAVCSCLLHRLTGQDDIVVGSPAAGQLSAGAKDAVGYCVNLLPLRSRVSGNPTFAQYLVSIRKLLLQGYENQNYSFARLIEQLNLPRDPSRSPLFSVTFNFDRSGGRLKFEDLEVTVIANSNPAARFDAYFTFTEVENELIFDCTYNTDLFDDCTIGRWMEYYRNLLVEVVNDPSRRIRDLKMLSEAERRQLLVDWNDTANPYPQNECLHELIEAQAARVPEATALTYEGGQMTYRELNGRANQLAHYLQRLNVGPEVRVGLLMQRTPETLVSILGVLKAGGAYVPLDPENPAERIEFMLADAGVKVVVTQDRWKELVPGPVRAICVDRDRKEVSREESGEVVSGVGGNNLAYVIYTSGSTGVPKGVMIEHRGLVNYLRWCEEAYEVGSGSGALVHSSIGFDLTVTSLFGPLMAGRRVEMMAEGGGLETLAGALAGALAEQRNYSLLKVTPAHLEGLGEYLEGVDLRGSTRTLILGGEALPSRALELWRRKAPETRIINEYGPTETVVGCCVYEVKDGESLEETVPIGRPIANTQLYILDAGLQPVGLGVAGELYVGGAGVARGYLQRAELTGERFLPNPYSGEAGARFYKTGDWARYRVDGEIEFLGRMDQQVKLRGYRVELGEIEGALRQHPAVRDSMVMLRAEAAGDKALVAYVLPEDKQAQSAIAGHKLYTLLNGLEIAHLNKNETDYIYKEIFEDLVYLKNGISLSDGDTVFDVGANIGLFTLFVQQHWPKTSVYAFEPLPQTFNVLAANVSIYGLNAKLFNCGLSNRTAQAEFTFYPQMSLMSGVYADAHEEESVTRAFMDRKYGIGSGYADDVLAGRYESETCLCPVKRLSDIINTESIEKIDLLKIDVEKSELNVLQGIDDKDWSKIKQIIIEVYDKDGRLAEITELLTGHGYLLQVEQEESLETTPLYNVYATHRTVEVGTEKEWPIDSESRLRKRTLAPVELRGYLRDKLPEYMIPSAFVILEEWPLTPNGKVDRKALPALDFAQSQMKRNYAAPRDEVERSLTMIWAEVLGLEQVGIDDNFLDLGGHSLLAIQVISRVRKNFQVRLTVRDIFESPTIAELAASIKDRPVVEEDDDGQPNPILEQPDVDNRLTDMNGLSDQQVDAMLKDLLAEEELN